MKIIITGGCGFIGTNVALFHLKKKHKVVVIDNLSRRGTEVNLSLLKKYKNLKFYKVDIRDKEKINKIFSQNKDVDIVYHLAAQVAVTTSVLDPYEDFEINALGTINVLEAVRKHTPKTFFIFSSTNKVYGSMENIKIEERNGKYLAADYPNGIDENFNLDFHSPYGCSKGAADQYVRDYSRIYGLDTVVFRQSCIYGPNQFGIEDQGWVAYFCIQAMFDKEITIYGDGKQVRDVLYIDDLIDAYWLSYKNRKKVKGEIFNIGGGPQNQVGILEFIEYLKKKLNKPIKYKFSNWRPGDQKYFVSDNSKLYKYLNWTPKTSMQDGVDKLINWIKKIEVQFQNFINS
jgi:CDP-paratose 2-epimerase